MNPIEEFHDRFNAPRRARILASRIAELLPRDAEVLDVGTGDGKIATFVAERRPDVTIRGIEVRPRERTSIPVEPFDGSHIPFGDASFDAVTFVDVLHHADDPVQLLREGARVARRALVLKDHTGEGFLARPTLRFMDWVGNRRHGIATPDDYWSESRWLRTFDELGLRASVWDRKLDLYPWYLGWMFDRDLHCLARLDLPGSR
jgi:SAM-dependent methyltransferase